MNTVADGRVYRIPLGFYGCYPPCLDGLLILKWIAQKNHPEMFDYDIRKR